jgi:PAS domain S-box-containing protein
MNTQDKTKEELLLELGELKKENDRLKASIKNNEKTNFTSEQLYLQSPEIAKHTQQNYETFFNTIDDFLFVLDEHGNIIHTNTTVNKRLNYTPDELLGKSVLMVHPIERQEEAGRITGEMLSGVTEFCPVPIITKSGVQIPVETRVSHGFWDGKPVIFGVSKDISKIKFSEEKFSKLFYLNPSACGLNELNEHKYTEVNDAFYNLLGFNKDEVIGKTPFELGIITDEALNTITQYADSDGKITNASADLVAKNGDIKHVLLTAENIYVQDKKYRFTVVNDITELNNSENAKKIAANALKDSESRMREIMENSQDAAYKRDLLTNRYHYFSPVFTKISGYKISEIIDMPLKNTIKLIHQDDLAEMDRVLNESLTGPKGKAYNIIYRFKHKEGHYIWLSDVYTVMRDADDQPLALIGSVSDITKQHSAELARKHAEEKLLDEKRLLSSIIENIPYQIYYKDLESRFIQCNPAVASNCGAISTTEMIGKTDFDFFPHDLAQQYFDEEKSIMKSGISLINHEEICINKATDHIRWNLSTKVPIKDSTGSVIGLIGINRDITTQKLAEETLLRSEEKYRLIAEKISDVVWLMDLNGKSLFVSQSIEKFTGYTVDEYLDQTINDRFTKDSAAIALETLQKEVFLYTNGKTPLIDYKKMMIIDYRCKDGSIKTGEVLITPYFDDNNTCIGLHGVTRDVTARIAAEKLAKHAETIFQEIIEKSPISIQITDYEGFSLKVNSAHTLLFGSEPPSNISMFDDIKKRQTDIESYILRAKNGETVQMPDVYYNVHDYYPELPNVPVWVSAVLFPLNDSTGKPNKFVFMHKDITERKIAEDAIKESEYRYRMLSDVALEGIVIHKNGIAKDLNLAFSKLLGVERNELINTNLLSHIHLDDLNLVKENINKGYTLPYQARVINNNGEIIYTEFESRNFKEKEENIRITAVRDITERHKASIEAELAKNAIIESERRYRLLIETSNEGILVAQDAYLKFVNPMLQELTGYTKKELLSKPFTEFIYPDDRKMIINNHIKRLRGEPTDHIYAFRLIRKDKSLKWVEITGAVMDWDGKPATINFITDISERISAENAEKQANEKLKESQAKYQFIVENTDDILWTMNPDFTFDYISPSVYKFLGYTVEEHLKHSLEDFFTPESAKKVTEEFQIGMMHLQKKEYDKLRNKAELEIEFIRKDKTHGHGIITMTMIRDEQHRIKKIRGLTTDITDRKHAMEEIQRSNNFLNSVIDNIPNMVFIKDAQELRFVRFNRAGENLLGVSEKEMLGKNDYDFFVKKDADKFTKIDREVLLNKELVDIPEEELFTVDKNIRIIHTKKVPIFNSHGEPEYLLGISEDITEQKQIEKQRNLSSELLGFLNSDNDLQNIMYNIAKAIQNTMQFSAVGIRIKDGKNFPYISQTGFSDNFLSTENSLIAIKQTDNKSINKKDKPFLECTCGLVISGKTNSLLTDKGSFWTNDYETLKELNPDLDPRLSPRNRCIHLGYNSVALIPIKTNKEVIGLLQINEKKKGAFSGDMINFFENICFSIIGTAIMRKQAIKALIKSEEEIRSNLIKEKELSTLRSQFISTISHEFRTPLSGILSSVQLLKRYNEKWDKEKKDQIYDRIFGAIEHTESLLKSVSIIERSENNKIMLNPEFLNLNDLLLNIIEENKQVYGLDFIIDTKFLLFQTKYFLDPDVIRYIVGNVLSNAIKYSGNSQYIQFNVIEKKCDLVFNIIDFGIGIPKEDQLLLFEPFKRATNVKDITGTGFGLNIVKRFVDLCDGSIEFKSELDKGTSVIIKIPIGKKS